MTVKKIDLERLEKEMKEFYNKSPLYLDQLRQHDQKSFKYYIELISKYVESGKTILDAGCGTGLSTQLIANRGYIAIGIDISSLFLKNAQNENIPYIVGDVTRMSFKDESFDAVASIELLEHVVKPQDALNEMKRILKKGGKLIIHAPNLFSPIWQLKSIIRQLKGEKGSYTGGRTIRESLQLLIKNTYAIIKRMLFKRSIFEIKHPELTDDVQGGDRDAVYLINPLDLKIFLQKNRFKLLYQTNAFHNSTIIVAQKL